MSEEHDRNAESSIDGALGMDESASPVSAVDAVVAAAIGHSAEPVPLPEGAVGRLLERARVVARDDGSIVRAGAGGWDDTPVPGVRVRILRRDETTRRVTLLLEMDAGARYPAHEHDGDEECFVLEGDLRTERDVLLAGDYQLMAAGSMHGELWSETGCRCLITLVEAAA